MRTIAIPLTIARLTTLGLLCMSLPAIVATASGQTASAQVAPAPAHQLLKPEQLEQLVAPIALYPDALLSQVLIASTYPLEIVQADRWVAQHKGLRGEKLKAASDQQPWDASIKALVATRSVLNTMSLKLDWTQKLGDAVLAQQSDVMDAVQRLRARAQAQNKLTTTKEQTVTTTQQQGKTVIVIAPVTPSTIYVPYYNPAIVYGAWPYPAYPPYYYPPAPGYVAAATLATGMAFVAGIAVGAWVANGNWGGGLNWGNNNININRPINIGNNVNTSNWQHNPAHRGGVRYNNSDVARKYTRNDSHAGREARQEFRGRNGNRRTAAPQNAGERRPQAERRSQGGKARTTNAGKAKRTTAARGREGAFAHVSSKGTVRREADRGRRSMANHGTKARAGGGGRGRGRGRR